MRIIRTLQVLIIAAMMLIPWKVEAGGPKTVWVRPYTKANGTSVSGHWRSPPDYGTSLSPLSPLISSSVGSTCYIPDYSMNEEGDGPGPRRSVWDLDFSSCVLGTTGGAGECNGFSITVAAGRVPILPPHTRFMSLARVCSRSPITNLPGDANTICGSEKPFGGGLPEGLGGLLKDGWLLKITPLPAEPICTDPETLPSAK